MPAKILGKLEICIVCNGSGKVRAYGMLGGYLPTKVCKNCNGSGFAPKADKQ